MSKDKVLHAETYWVENRCYRCVPIRDSSKITLEEEYEPMSNTYAEDEYDDSNIVISHDENTFRATLHVPGALLGIVKGKYGKHQKALEERFHSKIVIPPPRNPERGITICGATKSSVSSTYREIINRVNQARVKEDFTHFVSIPINSSEIQESFLNFKKEILEKYNKTKGIDASIFQNPRKLHATISALVLLDKRETTQAESILKNCMDNVLKNFDDKELLVHVKGIEYMNDDPGEVDVLYAKLTQVEGDASLQLLADKIMETFVNENLSKDKYEKVKLHITLLNTLFRESKSDEDENVRRTFDARPILKEYLDYDFGKITVSEIHISIRHSESFPDGYYSPSCKVKLK